MEDNKLEIGGFLFTDSQDYFIAKKEAESIEYMKSIMNLDDLNKSIKLYHKLVNHKTFKTVVGYSFLAELRKSIIKEGIITDKDLPGIPVNYDKDNRKNYSGLLHQDVKQEEVFLNYRTKIRNSRIVCVFLLGIIIVMMLIAIFGDRSRYTNFENKIINKYSAWEENLSAREKALQEKENMQSVD